MRVVFSFITVCILSGADNSLPPTLPIWKTNETNKQTQQKKTKIEERFKTQ